MLGMLYKYSFHLRLFWLQSNILLCLLRKLTSMPTSLVWKCSLFVLTYLWKAHSHISSFHVTLYSYWYLHHNAQNICELTFVWDLCKSRGDSIYFASKSSPLYNIPPFIHKFSLIILIRIFLMFCSFFFFQVRERSFTSTVQIKI